MFVEVVEIVTLQELVGELSEGKTVARLTVETFLHRLLGHHVVDGDVLANVAHKIQELEVLHPVVVVHQFCTVGRIAFKIEEMSQLSLDAGHVVAEGLFVQQVTFSALARGVANHACSPTDECEGFVATTLEMAQHHHAAKVTDVERIGCGVDAEVCCYLFFLEQFICTWHHLVNHASPSKFLYEIFHVVVLFLNFGCKGSE